TRSSVGRMPPESDSQGTHRSMLCNKQGRLGCARVGAHDRGGFETRPYRPASMPNDPRPRRRFLRLPGYDYSQAGAYFITACTQNRVMLFGEVSPRSTGGGFETRPYMRCAIE